MDLDRDACYRALLTRDARFDGRFFTGVKTTGIYCRPVCPARPPKLENVVFYPSAAAAQEAGFRPCLRCRPETSPDLGAWRGASNTVSRALSLIDAGALDAASVDELAERLGVGERQLRRLFRQHLGASPVAVAQTRRVLFAKQLIVETRMPMTEIALAAGFGSLRRFNAAFADLYQRPPRALRRAHADEGQDLAGATGVVLRLGYAAPYDWDAILGYLGMRAIPGVEVVTRGEYHRTIRLDGETGTISIANNPDRRSLRARIDFPKVSAFAEIVRRIRRVFDLSADPQAISAHLAQDPALAPLVARRPGLRVPGAWDGLELGIRAILGQQITVVAARNLAARLVAQHGIPIRPTPTEGLTHAFPDAETLAEADFANLGMPGSRARALAGLSARIAADPALFGPGHTLDEIEARLVALPGIGAWTAQYIAMRAMREPDAFPAADVGLMRALAPDGQPSPTAAQLLTRADPWRPWRAYAALHLWTSLADRAEPQAKETTLAA